MLLSLQLVDPDSIGEAEQDIAINLRQPASFLDKLLLSLAPINFMHKVLCLIVYCLGR